MLEASILHKSQPWYSTKTSACLPVIPANVWGIEWDRFPIIHRITLCRKVSQAPMFFETARFPLKFTTKDSLSPEDPQFLTSALVILYVCVDSCLNSIHVRWRSIVSMFRNMTSMPVSQIPQNTTGQLSGTYCLFVASMFHYQTCQGMPRDCTSPKY